MERFTIISFKKKIIKIPEGKEHASDYNNLIKGICEFLFYPTFNKEVEINEGSCKRIKPKKILSLITKTNSSKKRILESINLFAKSKNIANFIVIGRLQRDGFLSWADYTDLKVQY